MSGPEIQKSTRLFFFACLIAAVPFFSSAAFAQPVNGSNLTLTGGDSVSDRPFVKMDVPEGSFRMVAFGSANGGVGVYAPNQSYPSFWVDMFAQPGMLSITDVGVKIGSSFDPQAAVHVRSDGRTLSSQNSIGEAKIIIENAGDHEEEVRTLLELKNPGGNRFDLTNPISGRTWAFQTNKSDNFLINLLGSGGNEFSIRKSGLVTMGPGGVQNFLLDPAGNLTIKGTLNQASDKNVKTAFADVNRKRILAKVAMLPIQSWQYKNDPASVRHLGPTAQSFRDAFQLGSNDQSISVTDASGIALASIQALHQDNLSLKKQLQRQTFMLQKQQLLIRRLTDRNDEIESR